MDKQIQERIINKLNIKINDIKSRSYDLIVVKGIPMELLNLDRPNIDKILENKTKYFIEL